MSELKWIPIPESRELPSGKYALLHADGTWFAWSWRTTWDVADSATHYCPIPEPVMPVPATQDCPFCGGGTVVRELNDGGWYVACDSLQGDCGYLGSTRSTEAEAIAVHNRITLREVTP